MLVLDGKKMMRIVGVFILWDNLWMSYPRLRDKIWGWPGDEAGAILGMLLQVRSRNFVRGVANSSCDKSFLLYSCV